MRTLLRAAPALLAALLLIPASALARTETAHKGSVTATFSYTGKVPNYHQLRLKIERAGALVYNAPVHGILCGSSCWPGAVHVLDLEPGLEPDVVLDLYSGGAHCCFIEQVFRYSAGHYAKTEHNFGDPGASIRDLDHNGQLEFLTADDRFAYAFSSFAASGLPIEVLVFRAGRFKDVTRQFPARIKSDAATWWKLFGRHHADGEGLIAAWAADEDLLGRYAQVKQTLNAQAGAGHLHSALGGAVPQGHKFVTALLRFLHRLGYSP